HRSNSSRREVRGYACARSRRRRELTLRRNGDRRHGRPDAPTTALLMLRNGAQTLHTALVDCAALSATPTVLARTARAGLSRSHLRTLRIVSAGFTARWRRSRVDSRGIAG